MKNALGECIDIIIDKIKTVHEEAVLIYIDGLSDKNLIDRDMIAPIKSLNFNGDVERAVNVSFNTIKSPEQIISKVLDGNAILYYSNHPHALSIDLKKWDMRSVETPDAESVTRGPKESFTENILTNISLIRRKLRTPNLAIENKRIGHQTNTVVALVYLQDIVNQKVLTTIKEKLNQINTDAILETGYLEQYIEESPFKLFSGIGLTQKPDIVAAKILEGRVAILCDGTPHALTVPELFTEFLHKAEDFYNRTIYANFIRTLKILALILAILLPGIFVALITFSLEMIPFTFLTNFIQATKGTPFPEVVELLFLTVMFELLKEAGLRMPKAVGSAITIVGALILGDVAVSAGVVGAPSVIIIAISAVAGLMLSNLNEFLLIYRLIFILLGASMGIIGIGAGIVFMITQLVSTEVFGIPLLANFNKHEMKDTLWRYPLKKFKYRPFTLVNNNIKRRAD